MKTHGLEKIMCGRQRRNLMVGLCSGVEATIVNLILSLVYILYKPCVYMIVKVEVTAKLHTETS